MWQVLATRVVGVPRASLEVSEPDLPDTSVCVYLYSCSYKYSE